MPRILPTQATMPPMPAGGFEPRPLDTYLKALVMALNDDRVKVGDRIERRVLYGPTSDFPTARGGGDLYYDTTTGDLYVDTGTWEVATTTVSGYVSKSGDTMYGELFMSGAGITLPNSEALKGTTTTPEVKDIMYITGSNEVFIGVISLPLRLNGSQARPEFDPGGTGFVDLALYSDITYAVASANDPSTDVTGAELEDLTDGGATTLHTHDQRYYTETEVDTLLGGYLPLTAGSGAKITGNLFLDNAELVADTGHPLVLTPATGEVRLKANNDAIVGRIVATPTYYDLVKIDTSNRSVLANTSLNTLIQGNLVWLEGIQDGSGDPTTTNFPSGRWGMYRRTGAPAATYLCANYGGTLYKVALT